MHTSHKLGLLSAAAGLALVANLAASPAWAVEADAGTADLDGVVVTASGFEQKIVEAPA